VDGGIAVVALRRGKSGAAEYDDQAEEGENGGFQGRPPSALGKTHNDRVIVTRLQWINKRERSKGFKG
jgi:hypothetical protein